VIATIRLPLQVANLWPLSARDGMLLGTPNKDIFFGSLTLSSMVVERKSRIGGNESASYVVPNDATSDILSSLQIHFGLFQNVGSCGMFNVSVLFVGSKIRTALWLRCSTRLCSCRASAASKKATREEDNGKNLDRLLYIIYLRFFFICNLGIYDAKL
jgi:hypothetical protein